MQVTGGVTAWAVHAALIKLIYYLQHVSAAVPYLEVVAYAGYPFAYACTTVAAAALLSESFARLAATSQLPCLACLVALFPSSMPRA